MNIALSTSVVQRGKTGVAQYVFSLIRMLGRYGSEHQFTLFVLEEDLPLFAFAQSHTKIVPVPERFRPPVKNIEWHQVHLPALIKKLRIDVLHVPSYRRMLWPKPCALVATIHDLAPFHIANKYEWKRMLYGRIIVKRLARRQDEIIAISENTASDIRRFFGTSREKISVVYNGLDHERFFPDPSGSTEKKKITQQHGINAPFFLYIARLEHPAKNHVRLVEAFNQFKAETKSDWHLVFGGSDWDGAEVIRQKISQSPFAKDIHSLGFVATEDLPELYRAADVFVYPSLYEGFGLPPIEAMACGCPVISSSRGSLGEVVGDAAVIIDPENIADLKRQMGSLMTNPERRDELRASGFVRARFFSWEKTAQETFKVYSRAFQNQQGFRVKHAVTSVPVPTGKN